MSTHNSNGRCPDCGGTGGSHFNDCIYDGTSGGGYSSNASDTVKWILLILCIVFGGLCPPIGAIFFLILMKI